MPKAAVRNIETTSPIFEEIMYLQLCFGREDKTITCFRNEFHKKQKWTNSIQVGPNFSIVHENLIQNTDNPCIYNADNATTQQLRKH